MKQNKLTSLLAVGLLTAGLVGGTLAWFTSSDSITNIFNTGSVEDPEGNRPDAGIEVEENFNEEDAKVVLPGDEVTKEVKVTSTANYNQFVRVKLTKVWKYNDEVVTHYAKDNKGNVIYALNPTEGEWTPLDYEKIKLGLVNISEKPGEWTNLENLSNTNEYGYFYYNNILAPKSSTAYVLSDVTFKTDANDNYYKNLRFDVIVDAEGIQASNGAAEASGWDLTVPVAVSEGYTK